MGDTTSIILTAQPEAAAAALGEIQKLDAGARPAAFLSNEARLVSLPGGYLALLDALTRARLIFARHICPAQYTADCGNGCWPPAGEITDALTPFFKPEWAARPVSVQTRCNGRRERALDLTREAETRLKLLGYTLNDKAPHWVLSLFITGTAVYAGVSACADNRSAWNGGEMRFKKDARFISRSEFKLLEAFKTFGIEDAFRSGAPPFYALDLGAAPGGWTRALADMGFNVTAVDPAPLDARLLENPGVTHINGAAERFIGAASGRSRFNIIVNDMKMDAPASCRVMLAAAPLLAQGGGAVMTLKLSGGHWYSQTRNALRVLERAYFIADARQLFHNRDEVTVYMRAKP